MAGGKGFPISIGIADQALTAPAEKFNRSLAKFSDVTGISRMAEGVHNLGDRALEAGRSIERMATPLAAITSAATIGGMVELSRRWAEMGNQVGQTAYKLNAP